MRPIIALDIDGVLLPFPEDHGTYTAHAGWNLQHGVWLRNLAEHAELVWATSWMHQANWEASPALDLPQLPVVDKASVPVYGHPRRLAWVDDMFYGIPCPPDVLDALTGRDTMFFGINPRVGLDAADYGALMHWATGRYV